MKQNEKVGNTELPKELYGEILLLPDFCIYSLLEMRVKRYNERFNRDLNPIDIANYLNENKIKKINGVPEKIEIKVDEEGLVLDKKVILKILEENKIDDFPFLKMSIWILDFTFIVRLSEASKERLLKMYVEVEDDYVEKYDFYTEINKRNVWRILKEFQGNENLSEEELRRVGKLVKKQLKFIIENFDSIIELQTSSEKAILEEKYQKRLKEEETERRENRERKNREIWESKESFERWIFGITRNELEKSNGNIEKVAESLRQSKKVIELVDHHNFDVREFILLQVQSKKERRDRRGFSKNDENVLNALLFCFGTARKVEVSKSDKSKYLFSQIEIWMNAVFISEIGEDIYDEVVRDLKSREDEYSRKSGLGYLSEDISEEEKLRRDIKSMNGGFLDDKMQKELDDFIAKQKAEGKMSDKSKGEKREYDSFLAIRYVDLPDWKKWKFIRKQTRELMRKIGLSPQNFMNYIQTLIENEERNMKRVNAVIDSKNNNSSINEFYNRLASGELTHEDALKEIGQSDQNNGIYYKKIQEINKRILELKEWKDRINLDFIMSKNDRQDEIVKRERERRNSRANFRINFGGSFGLSFFDDDF
jgi:hypothetical protein